MYNSEWKVISVSGVWPGRDFNSVRSSAVDNLEDGSVSYKSSRDGIYLRQRKSGSNPESVSGVRISDPDDFQNFTGTFLFKVTFVVKFS